MNNLELFQKQCININNSSSKSNSQPQPMTLGTLIDNMISVVDLNTETNLQTPNQVAATKHLNNSNNSSTSLINAILTKFQIK